MPTEISILIKVCLFNELCMVFDIIIFALVMLLIWYLIYIIFLFAENQLLVLSWDSNAVDRWINYADWSISILIWWFIKIINVVVVTKLQIDTNGTGNGNNINDFVANDDKISDAKTLETGNKVNRISMTSMKICHPKRILQ